MRSRDPSLPKALLPVRGKPFAYWQLTWLAAEKIDVVYSIGYRGDQVRSYVGNGDRWGISVRYAEETEGLLGTGGAVRLALDQGLLGERFFLLYGDSFVRVNLSIVDDVFCTQDHEALMTVFENCGRWAESNVVYREGSVIQYAKGASDPPPDMRYIDYGLSEVRSELIADRIPAGERSDLADFFGHLSREGRLAGFEVTERFYEVGSPEGLHDLEIHLADQGVRAARGQETENY